MCTNSFPLPLEEISGKSIGKALKSFGKTAMAFLTGKKPLDNVYFDGVVDPDDSTPDTEIPETAEEATEAVVVESDPADADDPYDDGENDGDR